MKKLLFAIAAFVLYLSWARSQHEDHLAAEFASLHAATAILYTIENSVHCDQARQFLIANNVHYIEYDIGKSPQGRAQFDQLGGKSVPLLIINNQMIKGYNPQQIQLALTSQR